METINKAVTTVTSTIWRSADEPRDINDSTTETVHQHEQKKLQEESTPLPRITKEDTASLDRFPSVMGTATPPPDATYEKPDTTVSDLADLSLSEGSRGGIQITYGHAGYPYGQQKEDTITGSSTGNTATLGTLIDSSGGTDRDLEAADPRKEEARQKGHRKFDSGVHGLEGHSGSDHSHKEESRSTSQSEGRREGVFGATTDEGFTKRSDGSGLLAESPLTPISHAPTSHSESHSRTNISQENENQPNTGKAFQDHSNREPELKPTSQARISSNEPSSEAQSRWTSTAVGPSGKGFDSNPTGLTESSVGAHPYSGAQPTHKQQGADKPTAAPGDDIAESAEEPHSPEEEKGTGEKYERSTGIAAEGGDFDATRPGAGREADRLMEEAGVHRVVPGGRAGAPLNEGHKFGHLLKHHSAAHHEEQSKHGGSDAGTHNITGEHDAHDSTGSGGGAEGEHGKKSLGEKIKEKLHLKKEH